MSFSDPGVVHNETSYSQPAAAAHHHYHHPYQWPAGYPGYQQAAAYGPVGYFPPIGYGGSRLPAAPGAHPPPGYYPPPGYGAPSPAYGAPPPPPGYGAPQQQMQAVRPTPAPYGPFIAPAGSPDYYGPDSSLDRQFRQLFSDHPTTSAPAQPLMAQRLVGPPNDQIRHLSRFLAEQSTAAATCGGGEKSERGAEFWFDIYLIVAAVVLAGWGVGVAARRG
jgi:hypothetical protein